jgi:hypothetical protein
MKTQTINGVPYLVEGEDVYVYSSVPPIKIGTYVNNQLTLQEDWEQRTADWLVYYRRGLADQTKEALEKAAQLQKS